MTPMSPPISPSSLGDDDAAPATPSLPAAPASNEAPQTDPNDAPQRISNDPTPPDPTVTPAAATTDMPAPAATDIPSSSPVEAPAATVADGPLQASPAAPGEAPAEPSPAAPVPAAPRADEPTPADCAQQLRQRFPKLFTGAVKPLKLRIQVDIQQRAPGVFGKQALSAFFRRYTGSTSYLLAVARAAHRFDLDGQPSGEISAEHRQIALDELARRRANQDARRELEEQQRRNRAGLLHDFQTTTLTPANFCALKGVAVDELDGLLALARAEADERSRQPAGFEQRPRRDGPPRGAPPRGPGRPRPGR